MSGSGSSFSLGVTGIASPHDTRYSLGVTGLEQPPAPSFSLGVPSLPPAPTYFGEDVEKRIWAPKPEDSILDLTLDSVALLPPLDKVRRAMDIGRALHEVVEAVEESDQPKLKAAVCKTAKEGTQLLVEEVGSRVLLGGIPLLVEESIVLPPLALTIPVAAAALPQAYANMQRIAQSAGEIAEEKCEELFSGSH